MNDDSGSTSDRKTPEEPVATDRQLDEVSRQLLEAIGTLKALESQVRLEARGTPEFHHLNREIEAQAQHVFHLARTQRRIAENDSPLPGERAEQVPGDWSDGDAPRAGASA